MSDPTSASTPSSSPQRYRYFTVAPRTLTLSPDVLLAGIPESARTGRGSDRPVSVTCSDILGTSVPKVRVSRLRELLPDAIAEDADLPEWVVLPVAKIAAAYRPETRREAVAAPASPSGAEAQPDSSKSKAADPKAETPSEPIPRPSSWKRILKPVLGPSAEELHQRHRELLGDNHKSKVTKVPEGTAVPKADAPPPPAVTPKPTPAEPVEAPEASAVPPPETPPAPPVARVEPLKPEFPNLVLFQELFHTDEPLDLQGIADHAGSLPGLEGCVMSIGDDFRCSENLPNTDFNPREIRDQLLSVLDAAPAATGGRGAARTPTLTLYFDRGPISVLRHGSSSMVVLHGGRAFRPGIRNLLATVLETLDGTPAST